MFDGTDLLQAPEQTSARTWWPETCQFCAGGVSVTFFLSKLPV